MTRDDIIRMAREAGLKVCTNISGVTLVGAPLGDTPSIAHITIDEMECFAALVAATERDKYEAKFKQLEALMQAREQQPNKPCCLAEREACAKVCDTYEQASNIKQAPGFALLAKECAAAIRARGQE